MIYHPKNSSKSISPLRNTHPAYRDFSFLEYTNGIYQGQHKDYSKSGLGIFYCDDNVFYLGNWKKDVIHGQGIIFFPNGGYFYGNFLKNKMSGPGILKYFDDDIVCGYWKSSRLNGLVYKYDAVNSIWKVYEYKSGVLMKTIEERKVCSSNISDFPEFLSKDLYLNELFKEIDSHQILSKSLKNNGNLRLTLSSMKNDDFYFGYVKAGQPEGLGIIYDKSRIKKVGTFRKGLLDGIGKLDEQDYFLDGEWRNGEFIKGLFYEEKIKKYYLGSFFKNKCCNVEMEGSGFPIDLLIQFKQGLHKNSLNFFNQTFKFFDLSFSKELFYKIIVKSLENPKKIQKISDLPEHSPIKNENLGLNEPKDFKENLMSKSFCNKMNEERSFNLETSNKHILALSDKMNIMIRSPVINKKQELSSLRKDKFMTIPEYMIKRDDLLLSSSKKMNKIFEPMLKPDLPVCLKNSNFF